MNNPQANTRRSAQSFDPAARQTAIIHTDLSTQDVYDTKVSDPVGPRRLAVFVAHGMGQQLKYETLDQVAQGLIEVEEALGRERKEITTEPPVVTIKSDGGVLHGLKINLMGKDLQDREVHIFEGYWAPMAEGEVKLRDVIRFLFTAGFNGLRNFGDCFDRWLFGEYRRFPSRISLTICLLIALGVVASLVVMDSAIVLVAVQAIADYFNLLSDANWEWVKGLTRDLTTTYDVFMTLAILFGGSLLAGSRTRKLAIRARKIEIRTKGLRKIWGRRAALTISRALNLLSWGLFSLTLGATILCGVTIPLLVYAHNQQKLAGVSYWARAFGGDFDRWVNDGISYLFVGLLFVFLMVVSIKGFIKFFGAMQLIDKNSLKVLVGTVLVLSLVSTVVFYLALGVYLSWAGLGQFWLSVFLEIKDNISWVLLLVVSFMVRRLLVQYVGDVALYISPHTLDRFNFVRDRIRNYVFTAARAVYACKSEVTGGFEYEGVFIVGHSLGSVIAYDTLNMLLNDDVVAEKAEELDVLNRTKLLMTFGSPLDKTAFLFSLQRDETSLEREALVAAAQPLILHPKFRDPEKFEWINIFSYNDIISGKLDFYDPPAKSSTRKLINPVRNIQDKEATTLLAAHTEYWDNQLVFHKLHEKLTEKAIVAQKV